MNHSVRWTIWTCAAAIVLAAPFVMPHAMPIRPPRRRRAHAIRSAPAPRKRLPKRPLPAPVRPHNSQNCRRASPFTAADDAAAAIPGMPDARFWADSVPDFKKALPPQPGPWLILSTGGSDGAFGAGLLNGLSAAGNRPDYAVVTGVSTGALMAPFAFAGAEIRRGFEGRLYANHRRRIFSRSARPARVSSIPGRSRISSPNRSRRNCWPTSPPPIRPGRRLFVVTTDLDAAALRGLEHGRHRRACGDKTGGDAALNLFRTVLLASGSIPGAFPPVLIDVEGNGKHFAEMHVDGGVGGQFFRRAAGLLASTSGYRIPATPALHRGQ